MPLRIAIIVKFFGYTWWRVSCPSTFLSLLPLCCFPPHLGSQWGAAADLLRRRRCRDIFPHPVCTPVEASPHSTYTLFAQIEPENGRSLTKFTVLAVFGHHSANFTQSVQPQGFGWQNDDKNDDRWQKMMTVLVKKVKLWFFKALIFNVLQTKIAKWWQWQQKKDILSHMQKTWTQNLYIFIYIYINIYNIL